VEVLLKGEEPSTIIDIGANIGEFTLAAQKRGIKNIHSFEPDPVSFKCLVYNIDHNSINLHNIALGDLNGETTFFSAPHGADSSLIKPTVDSQAILTKVYRLEDFSRTQHFSDGVLVKMDAEGAEPEVLKGFGKFVDLISWISIDVGPERYGNTTKPEVVSLLTDFGFSVSSFSEWILHGKR
jgi:FkbM family methyltransferase